MQNTQDNGKTLDPFTRFMQDMASRMNFGMMPTGQPFGPEAMQQARRAFFDAMAQYCDDFMRSPQFLEGMKQTMAQSLAFRKQMNQFVTTAMHSAQMPTAEDMGEVLSTLRAIEGTLLQRVEEISARLDRLEGGNSRRKPAAPKTAPNRPAGSRPRSRG